MRTKEPIRSSRKAGLVGFGLGLVCSVCLYYYLASADWTHHPFQSPIFIIFLPGFLVMIIVFLGLGFLLGPPIGICMFTAVAFASLVEASLWGLSFAGVWFLFSWLFKEPNKKDPAAPC